MLARRATDTALKRLLPELAGVVGRHREAR